MNYLARSLGSILVLCLMGCTGYWQSVVGDAPRQGISSILVDYLYPEVGEPPAYDPTVPTLELPLRVGVAFVPSYSGDETVSQAFKARLLDQVRSRFVAEDCRRGLHRRVRGRARNLFEGPARFFRPGPDSPPL